MTELRLRDCKGKKFSRIVSLEKKDLPKAFAEFRKNLRGRVTKKTVYRVKLRGGSEKLIELIGIPLKERDKVTKVLIVGSDITERKKTEEELRESEKKYKFLINGSQEMIVILDRSGKIRFINKNTLKKLGYKEKDVLGKSIANFLSKSSMKKAMYGLAREFLGKHLEEEVEVGVKAKSGEMRTFLIAAASTPVHEKGKMMGILISGYDITGQKKIEEELRNAKEKVEKKVDERTEKIRKIHDSLKRQNKYIVMRQIELTKAKKDLENKNYELNEAKKKLQEQSKQLEEQVEKRTRELKVKMEEMQKFNKIAIGRELMMVELKKRIKELEKKVKS